jgi:hypothetical protein
MKRTLGAVGRLVEYEGELPENAGAPPEREPPTLLGKLAALLSGSGCATDLSVPAWEGRASHERAAVMRLGRWAESGG